MNEDVIYRSRNGVVVTNRFLRTRFKDISLAPISTLKINRDPLFIGLAVAGGLAIFLLGFGDLLLFHELIVIGSVSILALAAGYSLASLEVGSHVNSNAVMWATIWEVERVREAISHAREAFTSGGVGAEVPDWTE